MALDTVRDVLLRVDDLMKNNTQLVPLRLEIIRRMLDDVDHIRDHALKNPLEDRTEAIAHSRMGDIYFKANRIEDAVTWLTRAHAVLKTLADEKPNDSAYLRNLAAISQQLAEAEWRIGHGVRARSLYAESLKLRLRRMELVQAEGTEIEKADAALDVADSYQSVAYTDLRLGNPKSAIANYRLSDDAFEKLPPPLPNFLRVRRTRSEIQVRLGDSQSRLRNNDQALEHYRQALADREALFDAAPKFDKNRNANLLKTDVGQSRMYLGDFYLMIRKDYPAADEQYRLALQLFSEALGEEPDSLDLQQRVAASHYRLGITSGHCSALSLLAGSTAGAMHFPLCLEMRERLAKIDPRDTQGQVEVLLAYAAHGSLC